jgi:hypothetical protein
MFAKIIDGETDDETDEEILIATLHWREAGRGVWEVYEELYDFAEFNEDGEVYYQNTVVQQRKAAARKVGREWEVVTE